MQGTPHHLGSYPGPLPALAGTPTAEGVASAEAQAAAAAALASQYASTYAAADESDIAHSSKWQLLFQTQSEMASRLAEMATAMRRQLSLAQSHTLGLSPNSSVGQDSSKQNQITPFYHNPHNLLSHERRTSLTTTTTSITTPSVVPFGASVPASRLLSKQTHSNQHQNRKNNLASQQTTPQERFNCPHVSCDKTYATKRGLHDHLKKGASAHSSATPSTSHALAAIATDPVVDSEHEQPPHFTPTTTLPQRTPHHYACPDPFCGRSWQTSKTLLKHLKDFPSHSTQVALAPPVRAAAIESGRKTSVVARTVLSSAGDKPVSFVCPGCDKEFLGASNLKRHLGRFPRHDIDHEDEEEEEDKDGEYGAAEDELEGKQARGQEVEELVAEAPSELEEDPQVELADVREEQEIQLVEGMLVEEEGELEGAQQLKEQAVKEHEYELGEKVHVATLSRGLDVEVEEGELVEDVEHSVAEGEEEDKSNEAEVESQAVIGVEVTAAIMEGEESVTPVDETSGMAVHSRTNAPQELATLDPKTVTLADQQLNTVTDATAISIDSDHAIHEPEVEPKAASKVKVVQNEAPSVHQQASVSAEQEPGVSVALVQQEGATAKDVQPGPDCDAGASYTHRAESEGSVSGAASRASSLCSTNTRRKRTKLPCPDSKCRQTFSNDEGLKWHLVHYPQHIPRGFVMVHDAVLFRPNGEEGDDVVSFCRESGEDSDDAELRGRRRRKLGSGAVTPTVGLATEHMHESDLSTVAVASIVTGKELESASALATLAESAASQLPVAGDVGLDKTMDLEIQTVAVTPVMESPNGTEIQPSQLAIESEAPLSATTTVICEGGVPSDQEAAQRVEIEAGSDNEDEAASNKVFSCPHPDCEKAYKYASGLEFHFRANGNHRRDCFADNPTHEQDESADKASFNFTVMGLASASSVVSQLQRKTSEETPAVVVPRFPPDPSKPYACPISSCGKGYANKGALSRHMNAGKHGVHADTGKRKSRRMVEDTDPVAPEAGGAAGEEDEAEVTVDEDEGAPPTKRLRARSRPACAGASAPNSARAASASGEAEKMSLDMLVNGGIDAAMAASDSLCELQSVMASTFGVAATKTSTPSPHVIDSTASASLTPEDSSSIAVTRALHVTPKASSLRMRSRPTLSVNTPSRTPVSESQTESFRNVAISEQLASLATTEVDGAMVSLGEPDSFSEGAQKAAGSSSVDARSGKVDMASIAPAAESIVSSERGDAARTPSDTAVNASTASSSAQVNIETACSPQASADHGSAFIGSVNKKRKGRSATPVETEQLSKVARSATEIGHSSRPETSQVQSRFEAEFPTIATLDELDAVFCDHEAQKAALSQLASSTPSSRPETRSHSAIQAPTSKPFSAPFTRSTRAGAPSTSHANDSNLLDAPMGEGPEAAQGDDDDSPFECEPGMTPALGNPLSGWHYNLKFGAIVEAYSKSCRLWYPARVMYYIITDKNTYKLKVHYIGYTKKFDEIFDLLLPERRAQIRPTADDAASKKKKAPSRGVDKAKAAIQGVDFEEDSAMWELGDAAAPADLEGVLYEGVDAAAKRIGDFLVMDEDMEPSKKRK